MTNPSIYTVGWICALPLEFVAARAFFDEEFKEALVSQDVNDNNRYALGRIGRHNVVMAVLPKAELGIAAAATVARDLMRSFPNIRLGLMVGIGGGAPTVKNDIRLGDVVVSARSGAKGGILQYDYGKTIQERHFQITGSLNQPPQLLSTAVGGLESDYILEGHRLNEDIEEALRKWPRLKKKGYSRPSVDTDKLYRSDFVHPSSTDGDTCHQTCNGVANIVDREDRDEDDDPVIHYGLIASANNLMKDALLRDQLAREYGILCFEMEAAGLMNHFPCLVVRGICDYSDSHKNKKWQGFAAMVTAAYTKDLLRQVLPSKIEAQIPLATTLAEIDEKLEDLNINTMTINKMVTSIESSRRRTEIEHWLNPPKFSTNVNKAKEHRHEGSGQWFIDSLAFNEFKTGSRRHLWLHGLAGCGKTVLSSRIYDDLLNTSTSVILAHYFDFNDVNKQTLDGLLRSLVFQLYNYGTDAASKLEGLFNSCGRGLRQPNISQLETTFVSMSGPVEQLVILIDALDECTSRNKLLQWISRYVSASLSKIQFILTARPEEDIQSEITQSFGYENCLSLDRRSIDADIKSYVLWTLENDSRFLKKELSGQLAQEICIKVGDGAEGMFRWAACQLESLAACLSPSSVRTCLTALPRDLNETYSRMLESIHPDYKDAATRLLQFLVHHKRPLRLEEAAEIIAVRVDEKQDRLRFDPENRLFNPSNVMQYCPGMICIIEIEDAHGSSWEEIHITHFSVKEYLQQSDTFCYHNSAVTITKTCLTYLTDIYGPHYRMNIDFPLAKHAAITWVDFASTAELEEESLQMILNFLSDLEMTSRCYRVAASPKVVDMGRGSMSPRPLTASGLYHACRSGLKEIAGSFLQESGSNFRDDEMEACLFVAIDKGHPKTVKLLLEHGVNPDAYHSVWGNSICMASEQGLYEVVQLLLKAGADVNGHVGGYNYETSALSRAGENGHVEVARLLLQAGASHDKPIYLSDYIMEEYLSKGKFEDVQILLDGGVFSFDLEAALESACQAGRIEIAQWLLDRGAGLRYYFSGKSLIELASMSGNEHLVQMLLDYGVDITRGEVAKASLLTALELDHTPLMRTLFDAVGDHGCLTARERVILRIASDPQNKDILQMLQSQFRKDNSSATCYVRLDALDAVLIGEHRKVLQNWLQKGDQLFIRGVNEFPEPLEIAAYNGNIADVKRLIDSRFDMNANGRVLNAAVMNGQEQVVQLLLHYGVDVNLHGVSLNHPLIIALEEGEADIARMLLNHGANANCYQTISPGYRYNNSALHLASKTGDLWAVEKLLELGADIHDQNPRGETPLHLACGQVIQMLLHAGAYVNSVDNFGDTRLHTASKSDSVKDMMVLLSAGADVCLKNRDGSTPLYEAIKWHAMRAVKLLLDSVGDSGKESENELSLHKACQHVNLAAANLLFHKGANIHAQDCDGKTPLHIALLYHDFLSHDLESNIDLISLLVQHGADLDARDNSGRTALHEASSRMESYMTELLLDLGADINVQDFRGETPLFQALFREDGSTPSMQDGAKLLIEKEADLSIQNNDGNTPLHRGHDGVFGLIEMMLDYGADVKDLNNQGHSPLATLSIQPPDTRWGVSQTMKLLIERGGKDIRKYT